MGGVGGHAGKIELMVVNASGIVPDFCADILRKLLIFQKQPFQGPFVELGIGPKKGVEIVYIGGKMLGVVEKHGFHIDIRLQGIVKIRERQYFKGVMLNHGCTS